MFYNYCKLINDNCNIIPIFHNAKQHGLSDKDAVNEILSYSIKGLVVVLDAGTNDIIEIGNLEDLGYKCIVADHHDSNEFMKPFILVNNQYSDNVINKGLSGTGVTWKCLSRYDELYGYKYAKQFISYVMVSLISDSCPLIYNEQYTFIKWGKKNIHKNLIPLVNENKGDTNTDYSFGCVPLINSVIRMGKKDDKIKLFDLLCGKLDGDGINDILSIAKKLHNKQSSDATKLMSDVNIITDKNIILGKISKQTSLTGYVAQKLSTKYNKPVLLVHNADDKDNICGGSFRSSINIYDAIYNSNGLLKYEGGHEGYAGGVSYNSLNEQQVIDYLDNITLCEPCTDVLIDTVITCLPNQLFDFNKRYNALWGKGIPTPNIYIEKFEPSAIKIYDKVIRIEKGDISCVIFFPTNEQKEMFNKSNISLDIIGEPCYNVFNSRTNKQILINKYNITVNKEISWEDIFNE